MKKLALCCIILQSCSTESTVNNSELKAITERPDSSTRFIPSYEKMTAFQSQVTRIILGGTSISNEYIHLDALWRSSQRNGMADFPYHYVVGKKSSGTWTAQALRSIRFRPAVCFNNNQRSIGIGVSGFYNNRGEQPLPRAKAELLQLTRHLKGQFSQLKDVYVSHITRNGCELIKLSDNVNFKSTSLGLLEIASEMEKVLNQ